jgi:hypothetical protein
MTKHTELFRDLTAPFEGHEVKTRAAPGGRELHYITARTAMNRLDNVLGPENWWDEYVPSVNSVLCKLTIRLPDGSTVTKADAGGYAGMSDQGDDDKSGFSDSFKRACAKFGVARYLYGDGIPQFVEPSKTNGQEEPAAVSSENEAAAATNASPNQAVNRIPSGSLPRTGRALFAWTKDMEQRHAISLLKYLNGWAKLQEFPGRMVDWDNDQVALGYEEALRKLRSVRNEVTEEASMN